MNHIIESMNQNAIFSKHSKSNHFQSSSFDFNPENTMYFGTGLASVSEKSLGFGIEFLSYVFCSFWIKNNFKLNKIIHEISTVGYNITEKERDYLLSEENSIVSKIISNLEISNCYELNFSHEYHKTNNFNAYLTEAKEGLNMFKKVDNYDRLINYLVLQLAGMKYLYEENNTILKLGWMTDSYKHEEKVTEQTIINLFTKGHSNEFFFDSMYRYVFENDKYNFVYTPCAIDLVDGKRCVPYCVNSNQTRYVIGKSNLNDLIKSVSGSSNLSNTLKSWNNNIIDIFEKTFFKIDVNTSLSTDEQTIAKLTAILQICGLE